MFSLPRPRTSLASRCSSSTVLVGEASAPMLCAPCSTVIWVRPRGDVVERVVPVDRLPLAALPDHRRGQPLGGC